MIELRGKNITINLHDLGLGNDFLNVTPKQQAVEENIGNSDFIKIKFFCASKDTTKKMKRHLTE